MERIPPQDLVTRAKQSKNERVLARLPAVSMLNPSQAPDWCTADTAPSEWAVLQQARTMRSGKRTHEKHFHCRSIAQSEYPLAFVASGRASNNRWNWRHL